VVIQTFDDKYDTYESLNDWTITGFPFEDYVNVEEFSRQSTGDYDLSPDGILYDGPVVFHGEFEIPESQVTADTYWDAQGWGKGHIYVNGFNLGRYWPNVGPQVAMYIPKDLLKHGKNIIEVVELQKAPFNLKMNFVNGPIFINDEKV
jgi:beta-galactosidase